MRRVLKPGGKLYLTAPNFSFLIEVFRKVISEREFDPNVYKELILPIYGNQSAEGEFHCCPFTPEFMRWCLEITRFSRYKINIRETGSEIPESRIWKFKKGVIYLYETFEVIAFK